MVRRLLRRLAALLAIVVVVAACVAAWLATTRSGRDTLAAIVSGLASSPERTVAVSGLSGVLTGGLRIDAVTVGDRDGAWLALSGVEVDWSPARLLAGTFAAERIRIERIAVARRPAAGEGGGSGRLDLPLSVDVASIELPRIDLAAAVAGEAASLSLRGSAAASDAPLRILARLAAERTDGRAASLAADIDFAPDENLLRLDVKGSEPRGGILAGLLRLGGDPAVDISLAGEGPLADWRAQGSLAVAGRVVTTLAASHRESAGGRRVAVSGEGDFASFLPPGLAALAAGATMFDAAAILDRTGALAIDHAVLQSDAVGATASGRFDPAGESDLSLELKAEREPVALAFGADGVLFLRGLSASVRGSDGVPAIEARVDLASAEAAGFGVAELKAAASSPGFDLAARQGPLELEFSAAGVGTLEAALAPLVAGPIEGAIEARLAGGRLAISSGMIRNRQLGTGFAGEVGLGDLAAAIDFRAELRTRALPEAARRGLAATLSLSGRVERSADGSIGASGLALASGPVTASGSARLSDGRLEARISGAHADLSALAPAASGSLRFEAEASGRPGAPDFRLAVDSDRIESAGHAITGLSFAASGRADPADPTAEAKLSGAIGGERIEGGGTLRATAGGARVEGLALSVGRNRIAGSLDLDRAFVPRGRLTLELPELSKLAAIALETVDGSLSGTVEFRRVGETPEVALAATVARLRRGDLAARDVAVAATVRDYLRAPVLAGTVKAASIDAGGTQVRGLDLRLAREGEWTAFSGGASVADIPASAKGRVRISGGTTTLELASAEGAFRGIAARLARPAVVTVRDGGARFDRLALALAGGTAEISGSAAKALDLDIRLAGVPASLADRLAPGLGAAGTVSGAVKATGPASAPRIAYEVDWRGAATAQLREAGFGTLDVASQGSLAGDRLTFTARARDGGGFRLDGGGTVVVSGANALDLRFDGAVPFAFLTRRLAEQGVSLTGGAELALAVTGPARAPSIAGSVRSTGARLVDARSGIAIDELAADIALGGGSATIRSLTGKLSTGGRLTAGGTVGIDPARGFPADLTVSVADGRYTDGRIVTASFGGELKVTGPLAGQSMLAGRVALGRTVITVPDRLPASLASLDVRHRNAPPAVAHQAEAMRPPEAGGGGGGITLDVTVDAPQRIFIQGRGIDAEFGGSIRLTGPATAPVAIGRFTMQRGRLAILGKRLDFSRGNLGFEGSLIPRLDFAATTSAGDATATVAVTGEAVRPQFAFSSSPSLPEDEVLARLVFGRSLSNLSPLQIAQLASAAAQLAGIGGSTSLLDRLGAGLGVDDIDVRTDESTGRASVAVGKYLNDRTYVGVEKGEGAGTGKARIDLTIGGGVKLRGEAGDDGKAKGGIFFEREY